MKHVGIILFLITWSGVAGGQVQTGPDTAPGIVLVKVTPAVAERGGPAYDVSISSVLRELGVSEMESILVERWSVARTPDILGKAGNLSEIIRKEKEVARIFRLQYNAPVPPVEAAARFSVLPGVEYAEPLYLCYPTEMMFAPNDSLFSKQAFLQTIQAEQAWDITKGDSTIVIGVADTGIDWSHPDLEPKIWINPGEWGNNGELRDNGKDDDGNGLVDDWHGWDFAGPDNKTPDNDTRGGGSHGTKVAGLVAAATNNRIGVASIGYRCKILPMKIGADGGGGLQFGYQAMQYAVFMGCKVFNASWGTLNYSKAAEDVVNLVTSRGMLVVGGGGNHGKPTPFYPAAFSSALGVGMTNAKDIISGASGYGPPIDVMSPGSGALSTSVNGQYGTFGGTSAAAPIVSGLAGLVISRFPSFSPMQVRQRIRVTADNIDDKNPKKAKFAGYGRINAFRAVGSERLPSVRIESVAFNDPGNDGQFYPGEEVEVMVVLKNYLAATSGPVELTLEAATGSSAVTIGTATTTVPALAPNTVRSANAPMTFTVQPSQQFDREVIFRVLMKSGSYEDHDFFTAFVNPSYQTLGNGKLTLTVPADGSLGHPDYPANKLGVGLRYGGADLYLWMGALMIGTDSRHVVSAARHSVDFFRREKDFAIVKATKMIKPGARAAAETWCVFKDSRADSTRRLGVTVDLRGYDFTNYGLQEVLLTRYRVVNTGESAFAGMRIGLFMDAGGATYVIRRVDFDETRLLGTVSGGGFPLFGSFVIDSLPRSAPGGPNFFAINNDPTGAGTPFGTYDGFTQAEKWRSLSDKKGRTYIGPGNVAYIISSRAFDLEPGDTAEVVFGHVAGFTLGSVQGKVDKAVDIWNGNVSTSVDRPGIAGFGLDANYPNPFRDVTTISFRTPVESRVRLRVFNTLGEEVYARSFPDLSRGRHQFVFNRGSLPAGVYMVSLETRAGRLTRSMVIAR